MNGRVRRVRENSAGWLVKQMSRRMDAAMVAELKDLGLDLRQFENLMSLYEDDNLNQVTLARRLGEAGYTTSRQIDVLEERGLVMRMRDPKSRRAHRIVLTEVGRSIAEKLPPIVNRVNVANLAALSQQEHKTLVELLKKALDVQ